MIKFVTKDKLDEYVTEGVAMWWRHVAIQLIILFVTIPTILCQKDVKCRAPGVLLDPEQFRYHTCALCYHYVHQDRFRPGAKWTKDKTGSYMKLTFGNKTINEVTSDNTELTLSFVDEYAVEDWRECCMNAERCCSDMISRNETADYDWCPRTWDGWLCWPDSPPNTTQKKQCPDFIRLSTRNQDCKLLAEKKCEDGGRWGGHPDNPNVEWTNYTTCSVVSGIEKRLHISIASLSISVAALLPALIILAIYRQLHGIRISLHKNLFSSLLMNALSGIWFTSYVLHSKSANTPSTIKQNGVLCKVVLLLTKYFRVSNYLWMFCEGFYLHRVICTAFPENQKLHMFYYIGWGLPVVFVTIYAILRAVFANSNCWAFPTVDSEWVLYVPCLLSLLMNAVFFVDIMRTLIIKLRVSHCQETIKYSWKTNFLSCRKAVRATFVLVPLFGLHFVLTLYRPQSGGCSWKEYYVYIDCLLDGLQGAFVAIIFCYLNGQVRSLLKRSYENCVAKHNPNGRGQQSQDLARNTITSHGVI